MGAPAISVIVPCFNHGRYLGEAIDSVLAQTIGDYEILVGDDGSADQETRQLLDRFQRAKTRVFRFPHRGLAATRNALIAEAAGAYLCALDSDDILCPDYFETALDVFRADPGLTFVSCQAEMFGDETGRWPGTLRCDLPALLAEDTVITAALVKRDAVLAVGGYDTAMPLQGDEDWDLWISLLEAGGRGYILDEVLFRYRRRRGSMCDLCTAPDAHLVLYEYIIAKHLHSYERHLRAVLRMRDIRMADLNRSTLELEMERASLERTTGAWRAELAFLRDQVPDAPAAVETRAAPADHGKTTAEARLADLHQEYTRAMAEIHALRHSGSWTVTAPLRRVYEVLRRLRG